MMEEFRRLLGRCTQRSDLSWWSRHLINNSLSAIAAGVIAGLAIQPLDFIKTRKQVFGQLKNVTSIMSLYTIARKEGVKSFYAGY